MRRGLKRIAIGFALAVALAALAALGTGLGLRHELYASLPSEDGTLELEGLGSRVVVERDALGVPTIRGLDRLDVARATGFVHAQERFFQMDLLRRSAAGELAALAGAALADVDRETRVHRFRVRAASGLAKLEAGERRLLEAYAQGANAGLDALGSAPPEYWLLRTTPEPWSAADTLLVVYAMYLDLQDASAFHESTMGVLAETLPREMIDFLAPVATSWDVPMIGEAATDLPIPPPEVYDLRRGRDATVEPGRSASIEPRPPAGSNNWAVAREHTARGAAFVASDMHLSLQLPNAWFRASLVWGEGGAERRVTGVMLPGTPAMVAGSNGDVAWGFTNAELDFTDLVVLEEHEGGTSYGTAEGSRAFEHSTERIDVARGEAIELDVVETIWGPVVDRDYRGRRRALRWIAHDAGAVDMGLVALERATDLDTALDVAARAGMPTQNCAIADRAGRVGWTLMGRIPRRPAPPGRIPVHGRSPSIGWSEFLPPEAYPRLVDPAEGRIWTANNLVVNDPAWIATVGVGQVSFAARARQIRDRLAGLEQATALDMLALQLDDRALVLERWRGLLLELLDDEALAGNSRRSELQRIVHDDWSGRASTESVAYRLVREFRSSLAESVFDAIVAPCRSVEPTCTVFATHQWEVPLWRLVTERPAHLLSPAHASWRDLLLTHADALLGDEPLASRTWGRRNTVRVRHPLSPVLPEILAARLDAPPVELPGDVLMPRIQGPVFGASVRFVVSPGHEDEGLLHMPGGQSGHPLSPHYLAGHEAWVRGEPTPFLPGPTAHRLILVPRSR